MPRLTGLGGAGAPGHQDPKHLGTDLARTVRYLTNWGVFTRTSQSDAATSITPGEILYGAADRLDGYDRLPPGAEGHILTVSGGLPIWAANAGGGGGAGAPTTASYVVISSDGTLTAERILAVADGLSLTDGGAGMSATIGVSGLAATKITSGTLDDARLSSNVALENALNNFSVTQAIGVTHSSATATEAYGLNATTTYSIADTGLKQGIRSTVTLSHTSGSQATGQSVLAYIRGTGSGGTTTVADALYARVDSATGHTITSAHGVHVYSPAGSGTITTLYGVKIDDMVAGGTDYALYTGAGTVRLGDAVTMASTLAVTGAATLSSTLAVTGAVTGGTYNGQTISSAASFTGTLTVAGVATFTSRPRADLWQLGNATDRGDVGGHGFHDCIVLTNNLRSSGSTDPFLASSWAYIRAAGANNIAGGVLVMRGNGTEIATELRYMTAPTSTGAGAVPASLTTRFRVQGNAGEVTAGTYNGQTITSAASFTGSVTIANGLTVSAGGAAITGNSTVTGTLAVSSIVTALGGNISLGASSTAKILIDGTDGTVAAGEVGLAENAGSLAFSARGGFTFQLDNDNNATTHSLAVYRDGGSTPLFSVHEDGRTIVGDDGGPAVSLDVRNPDGTGGLGVFRSYRNGTLRWQLVQDGSTNAYRFRFDATNSAVLTIDVAAPTLTLALDSSGRVTPKYLGALDNGADATGSVPYFDAAAPTVTSRYRALPIGTAGQVLAVDDAGARPAWRNSITNLGSGDARSGVVAETVVTYIQTLADPTTVRSGTPGTLTLTPGYESIVIRFPSAPASGNIYSLEYDDNSGFTSPAVLCETDGSAVVHGRLTIGSTYYYRYRIEGTDGFGAYSATASSSPSAVADATAYTLIVASQIATDTLSAIQANLGTVTAGLISNGGSGVLGRSIRLSNGYTLDPLNGCYIDLDAPTDNDLVLRFSDGAANNRLTFTRGGVLSVTGVINASGQLNALAGTAVHFADTSSFLVNSDAAYFAEGTGTESAGRRFSMHDGSFILWRDPAGTEDKQVAWLGDFARSGGVLTARTDNAGQTGSPASAVATTPVQTWTTTTGSSSGVANSIATGSQLPAYDERYLLAFQLSVSSDWTGGITPALGMARARLYVSTTGAAGPWTDYGILATIQHAGPSGTVTSSNVSVVVDVPTISTTNDQTVFKVVPEAYNEPSEDLGGDPVATSTTATVTGLAVDWQQDSGTPLPRRTLGLAAVANQPQISLVPLTADLPVTANTAEGEAWWNGTAHRLEYRDDQGVHQLQPSRTYWVESDVSTALNTTFVSATGLGFTAQADEVWACEAMLFFNTGTIGTQRVEVDVDLSNEQWCIQGGQHAIYNAATGVAIGATSDATLGGSSGGTTASTHVVPVRFWFTVRANAVATTPVQVQWHSVGAYVTTLKRGSWMRATLLT